MVGYLPPTRASPYEYNFVMFFIRLTLYGPGQNSNQGVDDVVAVLADVGKVSLNQCFSKIGNVVNRPDVPLILNSKNI